MDMFNESWIPDKDMKTEDNQNDVKIIQMGEGVTQSVPTIPGAPLITLLLLEDQRLLLRLKNF